MPDENDFRWMKNRIYKTDIMIKVLCFLICFPLIIFFIDYYKKYTSPPPPEPIYSVIMTIFLIIAILLLLLEVISTILAAPTYIKITNEGIDLKYALKKKSKTVSWNQILKIEEMAFLRTFTTHTWINMMRPYNTIISIKGDKTPSWLRNPWIDRDPNLIKLPLDKKMQQLLMQTVDETGHKTSPQPPPTDENRKDVGFLKKPRKIRIAQK